MRRGRKHFFIITCFILYCFSQVIYSGTYRAITNIKNNIFRFQNDRHYSLFVVGEKSILVTDPINNAAASWLKKELQKRFPHKPIRYVIYSHSHLDHVLGGEVFNSTSPIFIAHEKALKKWRDISAPILPVDITFKKRLIINFEGQEIELFYFGENNGEGNISMYIKDEKVLFVVDWIVLKRLVWKKLQGYNFLGMIRSIKALLKKYDFDIIAPGHGIMGNKGDVKEFLEYLKSLCVQVNQGIKDKKSLKEILNTVDLSNYSHFRKYKTWIRLNIRGAYEQLIKNSGKDAKPLCYAPTQNDNQETQQE